MSSKDWLKILGLATVEGILSGLVAGALFWLALGLNPLESSWLAVALPAGIAGAAIGILAGLCVILKDQK